MDTYLRVMEKLKSMTKPGEKVLACVSGGPDSAAMLHIIMRSARATGIKAYVAHFNHMLRGRESDADAVFVKKLAAQYGMPFISASKDIRKIGEKSGLGPEKTAREERYRFFIKTAVKYGIRKIALAHNLDDNAETVLHRLIKGTGSRGLSGIPQRRMLENAEFGVRDFRGGVEIIRPLLAESKTDILRYINKNRLKFRYDRTNKQNLYERNRLRNELIPYIEKNLNPSFRENLSRSAIVAAGENDFMESLAAGFMKKHVRRVKGRISMPVKKLLGLHPALRARVIIAVLQQLLQGRRKITLNLVSEAEKNLLLGKPTTLPDGYSVFIKTGKIIFGKA